jgi:hypothetical protein
MRNMPQRWSDYSVDYKLFFILAFFLFLLFGLGGVLGLTRGYSAAWAAGIIVAPLVAVSVVHRTRRQWRWRGVRAMDLAGAAFGAAVVAVFLYAATPLFPPYGAMLPWYLFGGAIGLGNVLTALKITHYAKADFERDCEPRSVPLVEDTEESPPIRTWRDAVSDVFSIVFFTVWLAFVARFYLTGVHLRDGAKTSDAEHVYPVKDHSDVVYISATDGLLYEVLSWFVFAGIPAMLLVGAILHFGFKVPVLGKLGRHKRR